MSSIRHLLAIALCSGLLEIYPAKSVVGTFLPAIPLKSTLLQSPKDQKEKCA